MKGHVNSSGFPLQIAVKNCVDDSYGEYGWRTLYTEHSWRNSNNEETGFIDIVLAHKQGREFLVVECKRVKDTSWIFLVEGLELETRRHAKSFVFEKHERDIGRFEWTDLSLEPRSPESQFCVIPGADSKSLSLIERTSAELVSSTEGLASEDKLLSLDDRYYLHQYFNVIVTTATLQVCHFNPQVISIEDGTLNDATFKEVPYVRFRKQLNPIYQVPNIYRVMGKQELARAKENTVFVVNSKHLIDFLREFEVVGDNRGRMR